MQRTSTGGRQQTRTRAIPVRGPSPTQAGRSDTVALQSMRGQKTGRHHQVRERRIRDETPRHASGAMTRPLYCHDDPKSIQ